MSKYNPSGSRHSSSRSLGAKLDIRRQVLERIVPARVFDGFCGPVGDMWQGAWSQASEYVGCDEVLKLPDPRRRFVGKCEDVLRAVDLRQWNVFDFDAFGSPWHAMTVLSARRRWQAGELGAVVVTSGVGTSTLYGRLPKAQAVLTGYRQITPKEPSAILAHHRAMAAFLARSDVTPTWRMRAQGKPAYSGCQLMIYEAVVFRGLGEQRKLSPSV
jgi:hypothetical protein